MVSTSEGQVDGQHTRRMRLPRFSLRTLLVVVTLLCVGMGFGVWGANRQRAAVAAIRDYGGWVRYDYQFTAGIYDPRAAPAVPARLIDWLGIDFFHSVVEVNLVYTENPGPRRENPNYGEAPLEVLSGTPRLKALILHETQATDRNLQHVGGLKHLEMLIIWDASEVTDEGVAHLRPLKQLRYVHISDSQITDESLGLFGELPRLEGLALQFNRFTDEGLARLANLQQLNTLWLCGRRDRPNAITDAGIRVLHGLPELKTVGLQNTQVTHEGVDALQASSPKDCEIID